MTPTHSASTDSVSLRKLGFAKLSATRGLLEEYPQLNQYLELVGTTADPDLALLQLVRMIEAGTPIDALAIDMGDNLWKREVHLLGGSRALGDYQVVKAPQVRLHEVTTTSRSEMLQAVGADPTVERPIAKMDDAVNAMRSRYRELLIDIAAADLVAQDPLTQLPAISSHLSTLADAAIETALAVARMQHDPHGKIRLSVIALGKTGARELNYISDVDVMFLTADDADEEEIAVASAMARTLSTCCSAPSSEPPLWVLDAGLRPEGRDGALVRTVASALDYYRKWAANWEFQALLKARVAAGDIELGESFVEEAGPLVWSAASHPGFVRQVREMRLQVEGSVREADRGRELKLSAGGLRDVEFTVQLLQLVHGQNDPRVRVANTLGAIELLAAGGYIGRAHALALSDAYRFLRLIEHRVQLRSMRRTHTLPTSPEALRSLARSIDPRTYPTWEALDKALTVVRKEVRSLHEDVYYRPIVAATATLGGEEDVFAAEVAEDRLRTIGYQNPAGALRCIQALTAGTSRRAMIQRNLAPVLIRWFSQGADPDMGILSFRTLSEQIGSSHWYLGLLRDSSSAASRLCHILSNSRWAEGALATIPRAVTWLDSDRELEPRNKKELVEEAHALLGRHPDAESAMRRVASIVTREVTRAGLSDATMGVQAWRPSLSDAVDVAVDAALALALRERAEQEGRPEVRMAAIAMGRYGGRETSYGSDIDIMFVHSSLPGVEETHGHAAAIHVANRVRSLLQSHKQEGMVQTDFDLRPEGRAGALSRTVASYDEYYRRWSSTWERQALLRARFAAGDSSLGEDFFHMLDPLRWDKELLPSDIRDIRLLKARMENERLPRGADPNLHVKLGPGGLSDVEWTVQLLQLRNGGANPALRQTSTLPAIQALVEADFLSEDEGEDLQRAWTLASQIRSANVLASARLQPERVDNLPRRPDQGSRVATLLGLGTQGESLLVEQWRFASRRARAVMDRYFWG